jgi:hypothetical protein
MIARPHIPDEDAEDPFDPRLDPDRLEGVHFVTTIEEAREIFDQRARYELGISGEEFLRRWDAGVYGSKSDIPDTPDGWRILRLVRAIPTIRFEPD